MKTCNRCGARKATAEFYRNQLMKDGLLKQCKTCTDEASKRYRSGPGKEIVKAFRRQYKKTMIYKKSNSAYESRRYATTEGRAMMAAKNAVHYAIRTGRLARQPCVICGDKAVAHHSSYAEDMRLCVTWLCVGHHNQLHAEFEGRAI